MENFVRLVIAFATAVVPPSWRRPARLAATAALEHVTATFGHHFLTRDDTYALVHPSVRPLWMWHAIEELEHKGVCFDVYDLVYGASPSFASPAAFADDDVVVADEKLIAQGGPRAWAERVRVFFRKLWVRRPRVSGYLLRSFYFLLSTSLLMMTVHALHTYMMLAKGHVNPRVWLRGLWRMYGPNGVISNSVPYALQFLRPSFHPWRDDEDAALVKTWYAQFPKVERAQ